MLKDSQEHLKYDYNALMKYTKFIDLEKLRHEMTSFINYKIKFNEVDWKDLSQMIRYFVENDLKSVFEEIFKVFKIYLTIPICSAEAERAFSVLKLLKTWLRTSMEDDRLSDLGIIKMASDVNIDYETIIEDFVKMKDRRLKLI